MEIEASLVHGIMALDKEDELAARLSKTHQIATVMVMDNIVQNIQDGKQKITAKGVSVERTALLKELVERTYAKTDAKEVRMIKADMKNFKVNLSFEKLTESEMKIWEVFFDHKDKTTGKGKRIDPLILDLNRDGKFDITGANQEGNEKIDGPTVNFDIDPSKQSWRLNSQVTVQVGTKDASSIGCQYQMVKRSTTLEKLRTSVQEVFGKTIQNSVNLRKSTMQAANGLVNGSP